MLNNYFKVAVRNILKYKIFSFINIAGLAIGIACSLLIFLFARYELSYDRFHEKGDRIYRLSSRALIGGTSINQTSSSAETFRAYTSEFPEIESGVKFSRFGGVTIKSDGRTLIEPLCMAVDSTYFNIFTQPMIHGDARSALTEPNTVVLTASAAQKYFGRTDVRGELITVGLARNYGDISFTVTGVCEDLPENSHFHPTMLLSMASFQAAVDRTGWSWNNFVTYFLLAEGTQAPVLQKKIADYLEKRNIERFGLESYKEWRAGGDYWEYYLQPLQGIHLDSDINGEFEANGNRNYVYMFMVISVVILVIACFNFMNLSTARSSLRAREVSIRKVVGSSRWGLIRQFLGESVFLSLLACVIAIGLVYLLLPGYRNIVGREIGFDLLSSPLIIPGLAGFGILLGMLSGIYPAFVLSSIDPVRAMKGRMGTDSRVLW
ncbi:MAG: ABC transporter permease, partial [Bacteroidales bacterium]|nr:ABC transporter permease [Candidatus Latescibacterota bacterium]